MRVYSEMRSISIYLESFFGSGNFLRTSWKIRTSDLYNFREKFAFVMVLWRWCFEFHFTRPYAQSRNQEAMTVISINQEYNYVIFIANDNEIRTSSENWRQHWKIAFHCRIWGSSRSPLNFGKMEGVTRNESPGYKKCF